MFVEAPQTIDIVLYYRPTKNGMGLKVEADPEKIPEDAKAAWTKVTFKMRQLSWKLYNDLLRESKVTNHATMSDDTDWSTYKEKKLVRLLAAWDAKDKDGKDIPLKPDKILAMHPVMAETLLIEFDKKVYMDEEEQKN